MDNSNNNNNNNNAMYSTTHSMHLLFLFVACGALILALVHPLLLFFCSIALAFLLLLMKRPLYSLWLLIILIPGGQLLRVPIAESGAQEIALMANDLLIPIVVALWLLKKFLKREEIIFPKNSLAILAFSLLGCISLIVASTHFKIGTIITSGLYLVRWIEYATLFFLSYDLVRRERDIKHLSWILIASIFVFAVLGFIQYIVFPDFSFMVKYGWDPHLERLVSSFLDPNYAGIFLANGIALLMSIFYRKIALAWHQIEKKEISALSRKERQHLIRRIALKLLLLLTAVPLFFALVLTYSRSTLLAMGLIVLFFGVVRDKKLLLVAGLCATVIFVLFPRYQERLTESFDASTSAYKRIESWTNALKILETTNPVVGIGYNTYRPTQIEYGFITEEELARSGAGTDSSLLLILVTTGLGGVFLYAIFVYNAISLGLKSYARTVMYSSAFSLSFVASILGLLLHSQFVNSLLYPFVLLYFWIGMGVVTRFSEKSLDFPTKNSSKLIGVSVTKYH